MKIFAPLQVLTAFLASCLLPTVVQSHGVQVRHCITPSNKLRIFVEHWHGALTKISDASGMKWKKDGGPEYDIYPDGLANGVDADNLPGCKTACTTFASGCTKTKPGAMVPNFSAGGANEENNWVYYDMAIGSEYTLIDGLNFFQLKCPKVGQFGAEYAGDVYPVTISAKDSDCGCGECTELGQQCCTPTSTQYEECVYAADLSLTAISRPTAGGTKCCTHPHDPLRIILQHHAFSCPAPAAPTTPSPTPAPIPTPPPVTLPTPPPVPSTCPCTELGQQCCAVGSPTQYEECVYAADGSIVPIFRPTAPGTKCCPHTYDAKRIILEHVGMTCPAPTTRVPTPAPVQVPTPPPVPSTCVCTELGQQCCNVNSPTQYEECIYADDVSISPIFRPTAPGTKCCVHTSDPKRIVQQHVGMPCP